LLVYTIDAHPLTDPSPYAGRPWELPWSTVRQPLTYNARLANAAHMIANITLDPAFTVVVDDLAPRNSTAGSNPLWCEYGPAPNAAWLVAQNGSVALAQTWFEHDAMARALDVLLHLR
jgi:hypothetical protein